MSRSFLFWSGALIAVFIADGLGLKFLAVQDVSVPQTLFLRGAGSLLCVLLFARRQRLPLFPRSPRTQILRAAIAGVALSFITWSYHDLTASAVSVLSSIDVPLLILLGPLVGTRVKKRFLFLSALVIVLFVAVASSLEHQANLVRGLASLSVGTLLICFGYFFIKKSMEEENEAVAILTPSLAIILYGFAEALASGESLSLRLGPVLSTVGLASGALMFLAYIVTMRLYALTDIATAEFPTLISSLLILPFEALIFRTHFGAHYVLLSIAFVAGVAGIIYYRHRVDVAGTAT